MPSGLYKFTPALEEPGRLQGFHVGREPLLTRLLQSVLDAGKQKGVQHFLLIGQRGIGKTHILLLLYHTVKGNIRWEKPWKEIEQYWKPLLFSEEQYAIGSFAELLIEILKLLNEEEPDERVHSLLLQLEKIWQPGEAECEKILECLLQWKKEKGKRLLLFLDNIQLILETFSEEDQKRFRATLIDKNLFMIIASSPTLFGEIMDYEAPFYNYFEIVWIKEITAEEAQALLKKRLELDGRTDLLEKFDENHPRIRAIFHLTGGNPRLMLSLYRILSEDGILEVEKAIFMLLDELTPYFQDRMNQLPNQQRKIIESVALMESPSTPTEIAHSARLPVNITVSQLHRLQKIGYVSSQKEKGRREVLYYISEPLFRLWRQMRVEAGRKRLRFIAQFLKIWFSEEELLEFALRTLNEMNRSIQMIQIEQTVRTALTLSYITEASDLYSGIQRNISHFRELVLAGRYAELEKELEKKIEDMKGTAQDRRIMGTILNDVGAACIKTEAYDRAISFLQKARELNPEDYLTWHNLGIAYARQGKYSDAIKFFLKAAELQPNVHSIWTDLGKAYAEMGDHREAIGAFEKALRLDPDNLKLLHTLPFLHIQIGNYDESIALWNEILKRDPGNETALNNLGNIYLYFKNDYDQAIKAYKKILKGNPKFHVGWYNLANALARKGELQKALEASNKAIHTVEDEFEKVPYLSNRGFWLWKAGREADSVADVEAAHLIAKKSGNTISIRQSALNKLMVCFGLSLQKATEGNEKRSLEYYQKALVLLPDTDIPRAQDLLIMYFNELFQKKAISVAEKALNLIETMSPFFAPMLLPFSEAFHYLKTKDKAILNRIFPEIRGIVRQMAEKEES